MLSNQLFSLVGNINIDPGGSVIIFNLSDLLLLILERLVPAINNGELSHKS